MLKYGKQSFDIGGGKMRQRTETIMSWDFTHHNLKSGLPTNLPTTRNSKKAPIFLKGVDIHSFNGSTEGRIALQLDRQYGTNPQGPCPLETAIEKVLTDLHKKRVLDGHFGTGGNSFSVGFELSRKENSFPQKAIGCVAAILAELGIGREKIFYPEITFKKYIWVPKSKAPVADENLWGWIEFSKVLGCQCGLHDHITDKPLPELNYRLL